MPYEIYHPDPDGTKEAKSHMIFAIAEECMQPCYRRPGGYVINKDYVSPRREYWITLKWKCYLMDPKYYQRFLQNGVPIVPMSWRFKHQDSAFLLNTSNNNGEAIYPNFDVMSSDTTLDFNSVVKPLLDLLDDPDNGAKDSITSWFLGIFQSMNLPIVRNHYALDTSQYSKPSLPDYSGIKNLARSGDNLLGDHMGTLIEDNPADVILFPTNTPNTPEIISKLPIYDNTIKGVKADLKGSYLNLGLDYFCAATGRNRGEYWAEHQHTMYIFIQTAYSGEKKLGFALGGDLFDKHNRLPEETRNTGGVISLEELHESYGVEFHPLGKGVQQLQLRCNRLFEADWVGLTTMREENLAGTRHSKKLKAKGLLNIAETLEEVEGVRVKLGEAQASKVHIAVYHTPPGKEESLVALVTVVNTLLKLTQPGEPTNTISISVRSDTSNSEGSALFPSASPKRIIISSLYTAKTDAGEQWAGERDSGDIRNFVLTRERTYVIGMGSPEIHEETWGKDVKYNGEWREFEHGDKVLVRFADDPHSAAMRMIFYESEERGIGGEGCFQEMGVNDAPIKLSPSNDYDSDDSDIEMTVDPDPWVRGSGKLLAHNPNARTNSNSQRTVICGVIERVNEYKGESNKQLGMFVGASRLRHGGSSTRPSNTVASANSNAKGGTLCYSTGVAGQMALGECGNTGKEIFKKIAELVGYNYEAVVPMEQEDDVEVD